MAIWKHLRLRQRPAEISDIGKPNVPKHSNSEHYGSGFTLDESLSISGTGVPRAYAAATSLGPFSGCMQIFDPAPEGKVSARLRSPPHIPTPADAIATRSHLLCSLCLLAMPFVVFPPPSHKLHLGSPRGGDGTRSLRERADRRTGTSLPSSARVRQATCPSNVLP